METVLNLAMFNDHFTHCLETSVLGAPHEHESDALGSRQERPRIRHPSQGDVTVQRRLRGHAVNDNVNIVALLKQVETGLLNADVGLYAKKHEGSRGRGERLNVGRHLGSHHREELLLVDGEGQTGGGRAVGGLDVQDVFASPAEGLRVLLGADCRNF